MAGPATSLFVPAASGPTVSGLYEQTLADMAECTSDACRAQQVSARGEAVAKVMGALPTGLAGPHAWLGFAAEQWGVSASPSPLADVGLREALLDLYNANDVAVDDALEARVAVQAAQATQQGPAAHALSRLVASLAAATWQTRDALAGVDPAWLQLEGIQQIWSLARHTPAAGEVAQRIFAGLDPVDREELVSAGLTVTLAVSELQPFLVEVCRDADLDLPFVRVGAAGNSTHDGPFLLLIDCSGEDLYTGSVGSGAPFTVGGVGLIFDVKGNDTYVAASNAQGSGIASLGFLYDGGGADFYSVHSSGHGHGAAGIGMLYDAGSGADTYTSPNGSIAVSTKGSGLAGIGMLIDEGGDDVFHQDRTDGMAYAALGGFSILASRGNGNDMFLSAGVHRISPGLDELVPEELRDIVPPISGPTVETHVGPIQASSELTGAAILFEEGGDDFYLCAGDVRQACQGAASDLAVAFLLDRGGDDRYELGVSISLTLEGVYEVGRGLYEVSASLPGTFTRLGLDFTAAICAIFVGLATDPAACWDATQPGYDAERLLFAPIESYPEPPTSLDLPTFPMGQGAAYSLSIPVLGPGIALLRDDAGDDTYSAERWAQGYATLGIGILVDRGGEDSYNSPPPASGSRSDGESWQDGLGGYGQDE